MHPSRTRPRQCNAPCGDRGHAAPPAPTAPAAAAAEEPRGRVLHRGYRTRRCQGNIPAPHLPSPKSPKLWKETESVLTTVPFYPEKKALPFVYRCVHVCVCHVEAQNVLQYIRRNALTHRWSTQPLRAQAARGRDPPGHPGQSGGASPRPATAHASLQPRGRSPPRALRQQQTAPGQKEPHSFK